MNADGSDPRNLTNGAVPGAFDPEWSPDGRRIAFTGGFGIDYDIVLMDSDGSNLTRLVHPEMWDLEPTWSPNGKLLAFNGSWESQDEEAEQINAIFVMDVDGTGVRQVTSGPGDSWPEWSPKSARKLLFHRSANYRTDIWSVKLGKKSRLHQLTHAEPNEGNAWPAWSPDGKKIAFFSNRRGACCNQNLHDIFVMNADGSGQFRITPNNVFGIFPTWSPDGSLILFPGRLAGDTRGVDMLLTVPSSGVGTPVALLTDGSYDDFDAADWLEVRKS